MIFSQNMVVSLIFCSRGLNYIIWGIGEIFCTPRGAQGGAEGADLGAQREQITAVNFAPFWYPYFKSR